MGKELPGVFKNPIEHEVKNNKEVFYMSKEQEIDSEVRDSSFQSMEEKYKEKLIGNDIPRKINDIFSSPKYVYKADVEIKLKDGIVVKKIIGKNRNALITIDNELIQIDEIEDIRLAK